MTGSWSERISSSSDSGGGPARTFVRSALGWSPIVSDFRGHLADLAEGVLWLPSLLDGDDRLQGWRTTGASVLRLFLRYTFHCKGE